MTKAELKKWLDGKQLSGVILVCPRCDKVDINPKTHLDECDPEFEAYRQQNMDRMYD